MPNFAVFDCEDAQKWSGHEKLYTEAFGGTEASWDVFKCWDKELPDLRVAEQYRGIFISGSHYSAYEDLPWINDLVTWLHDFVDRQHSTRIVAVCFGCQVLARALGGKVGKNPSQRFVLTVEELQLTKALFGKEYFRAAVSQQPTGKGDTELPATLKIIESHGDQVLELPPGAQLLASSATAPNEVWTMGDRVLAIQGHPEMAPEEALAKIHSTLSSNGRLSGEEAAASRAALEGTPPDSATIRRIMEAFVQQGAKSGSALSPLLEGSKAGEGAPAETGTSYGLTSWLPSVSMPAVSLPSLALPAWMPLPGLASSATSAPATSGHGTTDPPRGILTKDSSTAAAAGSADVGSSAGQTEAPTADAALGSSLVASEHHFTESEAAASSAEQPGALLGGAPVASGKLPPGSSEAATSGSELAQPSSSPAPGQGDASGSGTPSQLYKGASGIMQGHEGAAASNAADRAGERRAQLHAQAERLVGDLAGAVSAELDSAIANYELLFGVNTVSRAEFLHMHQELAQWQPLIQEIHRKQDAIRPLLAALECLEGRMDAVEGSIATLDADTRHLARQLGIPLDA
ncbi:probable gamma-glutamyl peptidase 4 at N-terminal half [Coccomyxa sp. Obi]|nr:probable gamma-glutamyl peptidase 4 at N-terminal half [Coccomyxa sp. Obi]